MPKCKRLNIVRNNVGESNHQHAVLEETNSRAPSPPPRKPRGPTLMSHIWELDKGAKVNVIFDANCHPIGKEGCTLTRFIGTIARKSDIAPINYKDWRDMPQIYKDDMWKIIEKISKQNKENRLKLEEPHCLGTKTFARFVNEKESFVEGRKLSRAELYIQSRTKKEGGPVSEKASQVMVPDANSGQGFSPNNRSSSQSSHHLLFHQNESNEENDGQRD
ncbi:hypothetical protein SLEP1_g26379 [Rubroshorea leprosula]|uniref:Uncharacterized protein n=1 Tax=Rubroshorea leprosula TaxID=152421 RepID=A0AAV5JVH2_9ROSI|nr:hypothetical protein SLEP1_g26379 [Rubroshorea leprosula]